MGGEQMKNFVKKAWIVLFLIFLLILIYRFTFSQPKKSTISENSPFSIGKIVMYSSAYGENKNTTFQKSSWILDILQYSDIAIYINHSGENLTSSNTVKKLWLENFRIQKPNLGIPSLYYLDSLNFGTSDFNENNQLTNSLEFTVLNDENKNHEIQSNTPVFFTDCSNPITLKYVNQSIKENFALASQEPLFFDGRLLEKANISLSDLQATIDFTIHIQSNDNQNYFYAVSLPIFLENENNSINSGSILMEKSIENDRKTFSTK